MAKKYEHLFDPVSVTPPPRQMIELYQQEKAVNDVQSKQENNLISRGHNRILVYVKGFQKLFWLEEVEVVNKYMIIMIH